jgi:hypothetical protein
MRFPGFTAAQSLRPARPYLGTAEVHPPGDAVLLQDCPGYKRYLYCYPFVFPSCLAAGLGGTAAYRNCLEKAGCLDCLGTADPRDHSPGDPGLGVTCDQSGHCTVGQVGEGLTTPSVPCGTVLHVPGGPTIIGPPCDAGHLWGKALKDSAH